MIVKMSDENYGSDEICEVCEGLVHTDGVFELHTCPICGVDIPPCNVCTYHDTCDFQCKEV